MQQSLKMQAVMSEPLDISTTAPTVSLKPKEHGAYAIVMIPIATSLVIAGSGVVGVAVALASVVGFFAHEPLLVTLGHRGQRAKRSAPEAKSRAMGLLSIGIAAGVTAMWLGSQSVRVSLVGCLLLAVVSFSLAIYGKHRTLGGQLFGVVALSIPCVPILLSGDVSLVWALAIWVVWLFGFMSTTLAVRGVIAAQKRQPRTLHWAVLSLATAMIAAAVAAQIYSPVIALPMIAMSWWLMIWPPSAKHLKRVGWTLVAATIATAVIVVLSF